jgi:hypothetical protein
VREVFKMINEKGQICGHQMAIRDEMKESEIG